MDGINLMPSVLILGLHLVTKSQKLRIRSAYTYHGYFRAKLKISNKKVRL